MSTYIRDKLAKELNIEITKKHVRGIHVLLVDFETRGKHPLTINSQMIGVNPIAFTRADTANIFDTFDVTERHVADILDTIVDNKKVPVINRDFHVTGNTLNNFVTWILHLTKISKLPSRDKDMLLLDLGKLWLYRFFTSLINNSYTYGCNESVMRAAINKLTRKSDIIKYGTWGAVIENQVLRLLDTDSIHYNTILNYDNDYKIFYMISDSQTRMRDKLKIIFSIFKDTKNLGDVVNSYGSVGELEGEKVIIDQVSTFDLMTNTLVMEIGNVHAFVDDKLILVITSLFRNIRPDMFKSLLVQFSELAEVQNKSGDMDKLVLVNRSQIYSGTRVLVINIIQKSYRFCIKQKVDLKKRVEILNAVKNIYSSSRISDSELNMVKDSVTYFIEQSGISKRQATISSLRIGFIMYVIGKTFKYL